MKIYNHMCRILSVNWFKTIWFNFRMLPFSQARKLPVFIYGKVRLGKLNGKIFFHVPLRRAMVKMGSCFEVFKTSSGIAQIDVMGVIHFRGNVRLGPDYMLWVGSAGVLDMGHMSSLGSRGKIICKKKVTLGCYAQIGFESQIVDTNFHRMKNLETGVVLDESGEVCIERYNYIGNRVSMVKGAFTPGHCTIASNTLFNKDMSGLSEGLLFGGIPAKLIGENLSRDWAGEASNSVHREINK